MKPLSASGTARRRALFLTPECPYPMAGGGALRSASLFEYLARRYEVDVITFRQPGQPDPAGAFPAGLAQRIHVIDLPFHAKGTAARASRNLIRAARGQPPLIDRFSGFEAAIARAIAGVDYELAVVEHFWCAQYEPQIRPRAAKVWLDLHNIESAWHGSIAQSESGAVRLLHRRFEAACLRLERALLPKFDRLLVTSRADAARAVEIAPQTALTIYSNALPDCPRLEKTNPMGIIFSGNLEYQPNTSAIRFFRTEIWPGLRAAFPSLIWTIAGKNAHAIERWVADDDRIRLTGPMEDALKCIGSAQVAIVPLLSGSGTRIKILEAWAAETAVVSTSLGAEGLEYTPGTDLLIADTGADFSEAVATLLKDSKKRSQIALEGRRTFETRYTWPVAWRSLDRELDSATGGSIPCETN